MKTEMTVEQMAAVARLVRSGAMPAVDSRGKRLPLRYWVALAQVESR